MKTNALATHKIIFRKPIALSAIALAIALSGTALTAHSAVAETKVVVTEQPSISYPRSMLQYQLEGDVLVVCTIDEQGNIVNPVVKRSSHPSFEKLAIQTLLNTAFKASTVNGVATSREIAMPYAFRIGPGATNEDRKINSPYKLPTKAAESLPEALQFDKQAAVKMATAVVYPRDLLIKGETGTATVSVYVDSKGVVTDVNVDKASHPEFGEATKAMMYNWTFYPPQKDGKAMASAFIWEQQFKREEFTTQFTKRTRDLLFELDSSNPNVAAADKLDNTLKVLYKPLPLDPVVTAAGQQREAETIIVEFYVDPDGTVQLPKALSANNAERGWAAVSAAKRWMYNMPTVQGKPVYALKQVAFEFK
jgi:TonB family protein